MAMAGTAGPAFAAGLERWGDAPALVSADGTLTYRELATRADAFASRLDARIRMLAIEAENTVEAVVAYLAALRAGVPTLLHASGPASARILRSCPPDARFSVNRTTGRGTLEQNPIDWHTPPHPELAVILPTSGSTGSAKLVRLSAANLQANAESIATFLELSKTERAITSLPLAYSYGLSVLNSHLSAGASVVLASESVSAPAFRRLIDEHGVTSIAGVPYSYELMDRGGLLSDLPQSVQTITHAGGRMPPAMVKRVLDCAEAAGVRFFSMYGQTEATARMAFLRPDQLRRHIDCIGGPVPGGELWVQADSGRRAVLGEDGALFYRGPNVMMGYASSREALALPAGGDTLRTGDMAMEVAPGIFRITGRESRFVKPFGLRIGLDDFEERCRELGIAAYAAGDDEGVVVACDDDVSTTVAEMVAGLGLPPHVVTTVVARKVPRLAGGKIDYPAILKLGRKARAPPASAVLIHDLFARLAGGRALSDEDTFQSLGGDSLHFVECSLAIETALGYLPEDWSDLSLGQLYAMAKSAKTASPPAFLTVGSEAAARAAAILLIITQHALMGLPLHETLGTLEGGAQLLMMLAGLSWATFQRGRLIDNQVFATFRDFFLRYIAFYIGFATVISVPLRLYMGAAPTWDYTLLISSYRPAQAGILRHFWFLENLAWIAIGVCLLFAAPWTREFAKRRPQAFGIALLVLGLAIAVAGRRLYHHAPFKTPDQLFVYFAAGWAFASTRSRAAKAVIVSVVCAIALRHWGWANSHVYVFALAGAFLIAVRRVRLPMAIARPILLVSAATFYIYQVNFIPVYGAQHLGFSNSWFWPISIASTLLLAFAAKALVENWPQWMARLMAYAPRALRSNSQRA